MDMVNTTNTQTKKSITKEKVVSTIKKVLLYTVGIVGGLFLLGVVYQILEFLFVGAILLIAWLGPVFPRRWR
jgi:hypothetical protein